MRGALCRSVSSRPRRCCPGRIDFSLRHPRHSPAQTGVAGGFDRGEVPVLIPSIDLMGGKIVQLVQGERKALEFSDFDAWIERFSGYPVVQLIDLDAALGKGGNRDLLERFTARLPCQVGGGIRS